MLKDGLPWKKTLKGGSYFAALIKNVITYQAEEMIITADGESITGMFLLLAVCNGAYYGGHLHIAPPAVINDGYMTLCLVRQMRRLKLVALFPSVKPGRHTGFKEVSFINCTKLKLEYDGKKTINMDGNLYEFESPLHFEIIHKAVKMIV